MTITKKTVNGKEQITSCTLATCCLTVEHPSKGYLTLKNEKGEELTCSIDEFKEIVEYMLMENYISYKLNITYGN